MNYKNGFFQLCNKEDGTYLKVFPARGDGNEITCDEIVTYLNKCKVNEYDVKELSRALRSNSAPFFHKLNDEKQLPMNETFVIKISEDQMSAVGRFYPPSNDGKLITAADIISDLNFAGIRYGILKKNIELYLKNRMFCTNILLARGKAVVQGKNAEITYHFNTDNNGKPKMNEDGTVDFHNLNRFSRVNKGDLLATLVPADLGIHGINVFSKDVKPNRVQKKILRYGKNIYLSEDGTQMYTNVSGHVTLVDDKVFVSDTYEVFGDVSTETGDISYDGNVTIKGNVLTGFKVVASGDVYVNGAVEGAIIQAGGDVVLRQGMQGMNRGKIHCDGDIVANFIENATVTAGGSITCDAILHSNVSAKGDIIATGRRGLIVGGEIKSGSSIVVKTGGSTMGTTTSLEVGIDPIIVEEFHNSEMELAKYNKDIEKMNQFIEMFQIKQQRGETLSEEQAKNVQLLKYNYEQTELKIDEILDKMQKLQAIIDNCKTGAIEVNNLLYPGVKLIISNVTQFIHTETHYCKFYRDGADIVSKGL